MELVFLSSSNNFLFLIREQSDKKNRRIWEKVHISAQFHSSSIRNTQPAMIIDSIHFHHKHGQLDDGFDVGQPEVLAMRINLKHNTIWNVKSTAPTLVRVSQF